MTSRVSETSGPLLDLHWRPLTQLVHWPEYWSRGSVSGRKEGPGVWGEGKIRSRRKGEPKTWTVVPGTNHVSTFVWKNTDVITGTIIISNRGLTFSTYNKIMNPCTEVYSTLRDHIDCHWRSRKVSQVRDGPSRTHPLLPRVGWPTGPGGPTGVRRTETRPPKYPLDLSRPDRLRQRERRRITARLEDNKNRFYTHF